MKYIKTYEEIQIEPQIGDYVIALDYQESDLNVFLNNSIGKIISRYSIANGKIDKHGNDYLISYENIPGNILVYFHWYNDTRPFLRCEIQHFSHNKEDLETFIIANKYNL